MKKIVFLFIIMIFLTACTFMGNEISDIISEGDSSYEIINSNEASLNEESGISKTDSSLIYESSVDESISMPDAVSQEESDISDPAESKSQSKNPVVSEEKSESSKTNTESSKAESQRPQISEESRKPQVSDEPSKVEESSVPQISEESYKPMNYTNLKAIWVSQFDITDIFRYNLGMRPENEYKVLVKQMIDNIKDSGFNTIILQIRPNGDSFYESEYYPASRYVTGSYGRNISYDVIDIFIEEAHKQKLSVQAWINPMRLMTPAEIASIDDSNPLKILYNKGQLVEYAGRLYLDPSRKESIDLIVKGAEEALTKYNFDGLHMDDYFYPTTDASFDSIQFAVSGFTSLSDFRISSINNLVKSLYNMTKSVNKNLIYGVSPAGNLSALKTIYYADVYEWCGKSGYIDYIMPQVYFGFLHASCPFVQTVDNWAAIVTAKDVKLHIGITLGKAVNGANGIEDQYAATPEGKREWIDNKNVISRSIKTVNSHTKTSGYTIFCYQYLYEPVSGLPNDIINAERSVFMPLLKQ